MELLLELAWATAELLFEVLLFCIDLAVDILFFRWLWGEPSFRRRNRR